MTESTDSKRRLSQREWLQAVALWELGETSLEQLSQRFGLAKETFSRKFSKAGVVKGSRATAQAEKIAKEVAKGDAAESVVLLARIKETRENHYEWITTLAKMAVREIAQGAQEGSSVAARLPNLKSIQMATQIVKMAREERYALLGLDKVDELGDDLPELIISEMTAEEIKETKALLAQGDTLDGLLEMDDEDGSNDVVEEDV